jgi:O-antigen ligase
MYGMGRTVSLSDDQTRGKPAMIFDLSATAFLFLFVLLQPLSIAGATIAYSGAALAWVLRLAWVRKGQLQSSPLDLPILIYWLLCAVSAVVAPLPISSWEGMRKVNLIFLAILVAHNVPTLRRARRLVSLLFLAALVSVAWAVWQITVGVGLRVTKVNPDSAFFRAGVRESDVILRVDGRPVRDPASFFNYLASKRSDREVRLLKVNDEGFDVLKDGVPAAIPPGALATGRELLRREINVETERLGRARAFFSHPVTYAMELVLLGCLAFGFWLAYRNHSSAPTRLGLLALWLVLAFALGVTLTRSAWLAFSFGCLLTVWLHDRRRWVRIALPGLFVLASFAGNAAVRQWRGVGLVDLQDPGTEYRLQMWRDGLRLIRTHPWFGVGMNAVRDAWWKFNLSAYKEYHLRSHFHSTPIQLAVMQGLPVLLAWIALMGCYWGMLLKLVRRARQLQNRFLYGLALGMLGATSAFLLASLVQYNFGDSVVVLLFWFLVGLTLSLERLMRRGSDHSDACADALP